MLNAYRKWAYLLEKKKFRDQLCLGMILLFGVLFAQNFYYKAIENRLGFQLYDTVLHSLTCMNLFFWNEVVFLCALCFSIQKCLYNPKIFLLYTWSFMILILLRVICTQILPLSPPEEGLPLLKQDFIDKLYWGDFGITKDLFFSGRVASIFLFAFCIKKVKQKIILIIAASVMGLFYLIQHIHYTIDIVVAPIIAWFCCFASNWFLGLIEERG